MIEKKKCLALFSGGLDSILAVKHMERLGYTVEALYFSTPFFEADAAREAAINNDIQLTVIDVSRPYLEVLLYPRYGYGKNMNPCVDCHGFMFRMAAAQLKIRQADFLISGEVLGQRPMSQRKDAMNAVGKLSEVRDLIIRPLSQKLLTDTLPVREGWVNKADMLDIQGRGRHRQIELAAQYGIKEFHSPGGGCKLTEIKFSKRLKDLIEHDQLDLVNIKFLKYGRHFRISKETKLIVGRHKEDNEKLSSLAEQEIVLKARDFQGPLGVINKASLPDSEELEIAASIILRYIKSSKETGIVCWGHNFDLKNCLEADKYLNQEVENLMIN